MIIKNYRHPGSRRLYMTQRRRNAMFGQMNSSILKNYFLKYKCCLPKKKEEKRSGMSKIVCSSSGMDPNDEC